MTDKLIAIVRFKSLPGVRSTTRYGVFRSPTSLCGPEESCTGCAFYKLDSACRTLCDTPGSDLYYLRINPKSGRFVVRRGG